MALTATDRATALGQTTSDLEQAGLIFNDAVRLSNGGLWSQPADGNNQLNYASQYEADIGILNTDIASAIANGATVNGVSVTPSNANTLTEIQGQFAQLAAAAPNAVGNSAAAAQAQGVLHTDEQLILGEIAGDANLQKALAANGVMNAGTGTVDQGFQALPAQAADDAAAITTATAGANLSDIGTVFNAATNLADGGLNASNLTQFDNDMKTIATGLQNLINGAGLAAAQANTAAEQALATADGISLSAAQALTAVHAETMLNQIELQTNKFDTMYATNPNIAARSTNDNLLDIIDIAQNDPALAASAGNATGNPSHAGGFAEQPGYLTGTIQHYQDNQAQTDFWSAFISGANNLNNALTAEANGTAHLDVAGLNSLVQQVQGYQQLGASFDGAQGGIFGARFDNELLSGTLKADTTTALQALNDIVKNGATVSATDAAQLTAAGFGYVADAADVSGNNAPNGGGTYVGTSTTVAGATTTHLASATTTTSGNVDGNELPTNNPVDGLTNNGFGVTFPASSSGTGGGGNGGGGDGGGGTPPGGGTPQAAAGLNPGDLYFENMFNDATRILEGGLWHNNVAVGNQGNGTDGRYTADLTLVQTGLTADVAANDFAGVQLTDVNKVLGDLTTALGSVQGAVNNDAGAEAALRTAHLDIINTIENDPVLQALSIKDGNPGFNFAPPELATPLNANTPHATFAELGAIFDDAQSKSLGGINADNLPAIQADLQTVHDGLLTLMQDHPQMFQGATGIHASTIVDQINLQLTNFDHQYGFNPDAARATNDNLLDITDIVAGDPNLTNMASANGVTGWVAAPATDVVPVRYQDNADQTNFWADFIASGNTLGAQAEQLVSTGTAQDIKAFVQTLQGWEHNIQNFDAAQGGIFEARFDNELLGANSTVGADVTAMIKGLETHNAALVTAAAEGFHANAADVSGNNVPLNGGTYNADGTTVADALSTATAPLPPAPVTLLTPVAPVVQAAAVAAAPAAPATTAAADPHAGADLVATDQHHFGEMAHHFHHMWG